MSNPDNLSTIYCSNLPWSFNADTLKETFAGNGEITDCFVAYRGDAQLWSLVSSASTGSAARVQVGQFAD